MLNELKIIGVSFKHVCKHHFYHPTQLPDLFWNVQINTWLLGHKGSLSTSHPVCCSHFDHLSRRTAIQQRTLCLPSSQLTFWSLCSKLDLFSCSWWDRNEFKLKTELLISFSNIAQLDFCNMLIVMCFATAVILLLLHTYCDFCVWFFLSIFTCICDASSTQTKNIIKSSSWAAKRKMSIS